MPDLSWIKVFFALMLAVIPAGLWGYIFYKKQYGQKSMNFKIFLAGAFSVIPLLGYKYLWKFFPWLNAFQYTHPFKNDLVGFSMITFIPLEVLLTFLIVGILEELTKFTAMKLTARRTILSIDDTIEMAICAALGFAFAENIVYFYNIMVTRGPENILLPFIFRSIFSTFAHLLFSGVFGYYYGMAHFAGPILQDEYYKKRWPLLRSFARIFRFRKEIGFKEEKMLQGLFLSVILHALFNIFLEMNWTFLIVPYLTGGYILLTHLLDKKEFHKTYGLMIEKAQPETLVAKERTFPTEIEMIKILNRL